MPIMQSAQLIQESAWTIRSSFEYLMAQQFAEMHLTGPFEFGGQTNRKK